MLPQQNNHRMGNRQKVLLKNSEHKANSRNKRKAKEISENETGSSGGNKSKAGNSTTSNGATDSAVPAKKTTEAIGKKDSETSSEKRNDSAQESVTPRNAKRTKRHQGAKKNSNKTDCYIPPQFRPPKLDTPEAIAKWREQRRKRWPTDKVVATKLAKQAKLEKNSESEVCSELKSPADDSSSSLNDAKNDTTGDVNVPSSIAQCTDSILDKNQIRTCRFMLHEGKCRNGDDCKFSHDVSGVEACKAYVQRGWCKWKKNCFRRHDKAARIAYQKENGNTGGGNKSKSQRLQRSSKNKRHRPTLLEKILETEKKQETQVLLNCLQYMAEKKFWMDA